MKNLAEFYNLKCEKSVQPMGSTSHVKTIPILLVAFLLISNCEHKVKVDQVTYNQMVSHRNLGLSYLEEERYSDAADEFNILVETAPNEPWVMLILV